MNIYDRYSTQVGSIKDLVTQEQYRDVFIVLKTYIDSLMFVDWINSDGLFDPLLVDVFVFSTQHNFKIMLRYYYSPTDFQDIHIRFITEDAMIGRWIGFSPSNTCVWRLTDL